MIVIIQRDGRVALIDFGQSKELEDTVRRRLCAFYVAVGDGAADAIARRLQELGIEVEGGGSAAGAQKVVAMAPVFANGLLDTAPLPPNVDINPFSAGNPVRDLPIRAFNPDLFMILRTMGLLRVLAETLRVDREDCYMSRIFRPFALKGLRVRRAAGAAAGMAAGRASFVADVPSPFDSADVCNNTNTSWGDACSTS